MSIDKSLKINRDKGILLHDQSFIRAFNHFYIHVCFNTFFLPDTKLKEDAILIDIILYHIIDNLNMKSSL